MSDFATVTEDDMHVISQHGPLVTLLNPFTETLANVYTLQETTGLVARGIMAIHSPMIPNKWHPILVDCSFADCKTWRNIPMLQTAIAVPKDLRSGYAELMFLTQMSPVETTARVMYNQLLHRSVIRLISMGIRWRVEDLSGKASEVNSVQLSEIRSWPSYFFSAGGPANGGITELLFRTLKGMSKQTTLPNCSSVSTSLVPILTYQEKVQIALDHGCHDSSTQGAFIKANFI